MPKSEMQLSFEYRKVTELHGVAFIVSSSIGA